MPAAPFLLPGAAPFSPSGGALERAGMLVRETEPRRVSTAGRIAQDER